jgi:hypothetical protein
VVDIDTAMHFMDRLVRGQFKYQIYLCSITPSGFTMRISFLAKVNPQCYTPEIEL